ncbi:PIG-L family deacetylase [Chloroflexota bacterium]
MKKQKTLVYFGAHPDDESFGIGSTLAQYAANGFKVYYVCSTGGELGTVAPRHLDNFDTIADLRVDELTRASQVLGLTDFYYLGYRDSGMRGSEDNKHPDSMAMAPVDEVAGRIVKIIREIEADVIATHDEGGGYGHPDHVATHHGVVKAFYAAGDPDQYPEAGKAYKPSKLYFLIHPRKFMKFLIKLMPLFGQDPHHFGRNGDVDLTKITRIAYPINAVISLDKKSVETRDKAVACHTSQNEGRRRPGLFQIIDLVGRFRGPKDYFMRAYPAPTRRKEKDLFEGVD